jgi:tetratricopeptide (TPR) repeat protein
VGEAERVYRRALARDPELGEAAVNLALLYARQQRYELAQQTLDRPFQPGPIRDSALRARALVETALQGDAARARP